MQTGSHCSEGEHSHDKEACPHYVVFISYSSLQDILRSGLRCIRLLLRGVDHRHSSGPGSVFVDAWTDDDVQAQCETKSRVVESIYKAQHQH